MIHALSYKGKMSIGMQIECRLHVFRGGSTSNNLNQFSSNDSLSGTVVQDLVLVDHLASVLGSVLRGDSQFASLA